MKARELALVAAVDRHRGDGSSDQVILASAAAYAAWLGGEPQHLVLDISPLTFSQGNTIIAEPTRLIMTGVNQMAVTMDDTDFYTLTVDPVDSKGATTTDNGPFTWTEDSNGAVVTLQPSADGTQCNVVAAMPGSANVTVTDAGGLTGVEATVVTSSAASALGLTASTPAPAPAGGTTPPPGTSGQ